MQQLPDGGILRGTNLREESSLRFALSYQVPRASDVCKSNCEAATITKNGILVQQHLPWLASASKRLPMKLLKLKENTKKMEFCWFSAGLDERFSFLFLSEHHHSQCKCLKDKFNSFEGIGIPHLWQVARTTAQLGRETQARMIFSCWVSCA